MLNNTLLNVLYTTTYDLPEPAQCKDYFFHDVRVTCQTNHPTILTILDHMLGIFPEPEKPRGEATYSVFCYDSASQFPVRLPHDRVRIETVRLLTNTKLKYYKSHDYTTEYQSYTPLPPINEAALSVINSHIALTQLEMPEHYQTMFLRRYLLLIALGQLMRQYGFEPCHAAAITAPWDAEQGALIIGESGSGKTTLSLGCASTGCGLLGDDLVMLRENTEDETISAYTITHEVSVRSSTLELWESLSFLRDFPADLRDKRYCTIEQIRPGAAHIQAPIRLLLFPSLTTEKESRVTPLSKAGTLQELVDRCMSKGNMYPQTQERLFLLLSTLAQQAPGYRLTIARGTNEGPEIVCSLLRGNAR